MQMGSRVAKQAQRKAEKMADKASAALEGKAFEIQDKLNKGSAEVQQKMAHKRDAVMTKVGVRPADSNFTPRPGKPAPPTPMRAP